MEINQLARIVAKELLLSAGQVARTIGLFDEGNTIPFVARYRKEVTGSLDEEQLRQVSSRVEYLRKLAQRKETVLKTIEEQGKLTPELEQRITATTVLQELEDLYLPFKPKRRTRATIARERGLEPLARMVWEQRTHSGKPEVHARAYLCENVPDEQAALAGARDIVAEWLAEEETTRAHVRRVIRDEGRLCTLRVKKAEDEGQKYADYYDYSEGLYQMPPHRVLAINRGEREGVLRVKVLLEQDRLAEWLERQVITDKRSVFTAHLVLAIADGLGRLILPALEREARSERTEAAEQHAITVFGQNLRALLLQPPLKGHRVLALDPGYRTGCKVAAVDETGKYLESCAIYPHPPQKRWEQSKMTLLEMIARHGLDLVAIGNGTASRETETLVAEMIAEGAEVAYVMVSEAGASIYSASKLAAKELPDLDVSIRGAVSIGRRLQDPLAELVKIGPQHIGVGLYQHDVDQAALKASLQEMVESAVNYVGVDLATASPALLQYVSGLTARTAQAIVAHRDAQGAFGNRRDLMAVKGVGAKAFEQAAGFLRVSAGDEPLDNTSIHPESYAACRKLLSLLDADPCDPDLPRQVTSGWQRLRDKGQTVAGLAGQCGVGEPTMRDMLDDLAKPGRDPREELPAPVLRQDVLKMEDLSEGMVLTGTVRNVVDFGAFVDIGVKQDGLVHVSELADRFVRHPLDVVSVGDIVQVRVISVDFSRGRIGLSIRQA